MGWESEIWELIPWEDPRTQCGTPPHSYPIRAQCYPVGFLDAMLVICFCIKKSSQHLPYKRER